MHLQKELSLPIVVSMIVVQKRNSLAAQRAIDMDAEGLELDVQQLTSG